MNKTVPIVVAVVLVVGVGFCASQAMLDRARETQQRTQCMNNLRTIGTEFIAQMATRRWPDGSGPPSLDLRRALRGSVCPAHARAFGREPGSAEHRIGSGEAAETVADRDDRVPSYAWRDLKAFPLRMDADEAQIIACDAGPWHLDGVCVLYDDGKVEFLTWEDLGLASAEEFRLGPDGPEILRALRTGPD